MFSICPSNVRLCEGTTRREWLRVGGLAPLGLLLPELFARTSADMLAGRPQSSSFGRAKNCIVCFLFGAPAHQDLWDLKPDAPADVRGEFLPIATSVPGTFLGEHIPRTAQTAHKFALVRSVQHADNTHTVAMHYMLTGRRHAQPATNPQNQPTDFPTFGAVVERLRPSRGLLPSAISVNAPANQVSANNHIFPGFFAGFLGGKYDPLFISKDPSAADFQPLDRPSDSADRIAGRRDLLAEVDRQRRALENVAAVRGFKDDYQRAFSLVASPEARSAFDLSREPDAVRERYGRTAFGQGALLARRLVEAGVRLVTVNWARDDAFWDTHKDNFKLLKRDLLPPFDRAFSALLDDLDQRGLLDETLVVCLGEFGRTPKINAAAGRDHWAACNSVVLAGAGIRGGRVHGASDRMAAYPATLPVTPDDLAATVYHALGIDPATEVFDSLDRPYRLALGRPLVELFG
ncbi:MAG TPA: DUF1501 domain-containing protein [Pirellulales bacterium]|nr:DUF1501 domain-containing protein [Pirellulales bacterium]